MDFAFSEDLRNLTIFALVLFIPKSLMKFKIPSGITALILGVIAVQFIPGIKDDQLIRFMSQLGITALFVFAGFEVDFQELKRDRVYLTKYLGQSVLAIFLVAIGLQYFFKISFQESFIYALGILTPSAGFIMDSLHSYEITNKQEYWIRSKAIGKEVVSILLLFVALQMDSWQMFLISMGLFIGLMLVLPLVFKFFFRFILPYSPSSEAPFLIVLSLIAGVLSKEMGAYYLVGAFAVGLIGGQYKKSCFKQDEETILSSLAGFYGVFLPFYFFYAGSGLSIKSLNLKAFMLGVIMFIVFVPIRILVIKMSIRLMGKIKTAKNFDIALSLMPTLIFGLVIASILKQRGNISDHLIYALLFYTLLTSLLPTFFVSSKKREVSPE